MRRRGIGGIGVAFDTKDKLGRNEDGFKRNAHALFETFALLPGYFVRIRIPSKPSPALLVPDIALGSDQGGRYVLVVNKDNVVEQRKVEAGQLVGDLRVIDSGLTKDDRVVIGGIMRAIPGQKVDPELSTPAAAK